MEVTIPSLVTHDRGIQSAKRHSNVVQHPYTVQGSAHPNVETAKATNMLHAWCMKRGQTSALWLFGAACIRHSCCDDVLVCSPW